MYGVGVIFLTPSLFSYHNDGTGLAKNWGLGSVKRAVSE